MLDNKKTSDLVKAYLENDLYLLELLKEDLVNYSALSRMLIPAIKKENPKATEESISIAMRRYVSSEKLKSLSAAIRQIIAGSQLSARNDLTHLTFRRDEQVLSRVIEVSRKIDWAGSETFFFNQGMGEITVIIDRKNLRYFDDCRKSLIEETDGLSLISIKENTAAAKERSIDVPGVYSYFIGRLSRASVNIVEIISTYSQVSFIIDKDMLRGYRILDESIRHFRKKGSQ